MEQILNGRYRVGPKIGDGGMAVVYRATDLLLGRSVAIKVLREQYAADPGFLARFEREAQAVATLTHPNIVNIFDVGVDGASHYFVMELIDGPNLKEVLRARGSLPADEAVDIMVQVLSGLGYAHARGLVHRDIKPQNIMVLPTGTVKVTDFGIAKALSDVTLTEAGIGMGTVQYISPEQARGEAATPASDLYAAGVMLYELLTGRQPFTADSAVGVAVKHIQERPAPPARVNPAVPLPLSALTLRALEKDPGARFHSARDMAVALQRWPSYPVAAPRRGAGGQVAGGRGGARPPVAPVTTTRSLLPPRRSGLGCATWLVGLAVLAGLLGVMVVGFRLSPFGAAALTPTRVPIAILPTEAPIATPTLAPTPESSPTPALATVPATVAATPARATLTTATRPPPTLPLTPTPLAPTLTPTIALAIVPNLVGKSLAQSRESATAVGLAVEQVEARNSSTIPSGSIVEQDPAPGARLAPGKSVKVVVSRGPAVVAVPNVNGIGYEQAAGQLAGLGLEVEQVTVPSKSIARGVVTAQDPAAGATISVGSTVTLTVSAGDVVVVPNVIGLNFEVATSTLRAAGFTVNSVNGQTREQIQAQNPQFFTVNPGAQDGQVISQTLRAGASYDRGTAIGIAYYKAK